jgi:hypothetical protein
MTPNLLLLGALLDTSSFFERHLVTPAATARASGKSGSTTGAPDELPLMASQGHPERTIADCAQSEPTKQ